MCRSGSYGNDRSDTYDNQLISLERLLIALKRLHHNASAQMSRTLKCNRTIPVLISSGAESYWAAPINESLRIITLGGLVHI